MFGLRYFCNAYFAPRYFAKVGAAAAVSTGRVGAHVGYGLRFGL